MLVLECSKKIPARSNSLRPRVACHWALSEAGGQGVYGIWSEIQGCGARWCPRGTLLGEAWLSRADRVQVASCHFTAIREHHQKIPATLSAASPASMRLSDRGHGDIADLRGPPPVPWRMQAWRAVGKPTANDHSGKRFARPAPQHASGDIRVDQREIASDLQLSCTIHQLLEIPCLCRHAAPRTNAPRDAAILQFIAIPLEAHRGIHVHVEVPTAGRQFLS
jgi:hypothetical protein